MNRIDDPHSVVHVYLDEAGGGSAHVALLSGILRDFVSCEAIRLDPRRLGLSPLGWVDAYRHIAPRIGSSRVVVHAHGVRAAAAAMLPARRRGVPLVITIHGLHSLRRSKGAARIAALILNWVVLRSADRVLVLSEADRRRILEHRLASAGRVQRIAATYPERPRMHRLAARRALELPQGADILLWLGRLANQKDPLTFLRSLQRLERDDLVGLVVGDGPLLSQARAEAEAAGLNGRLRFTGWMKDPSPALAAADVFVSTSRWEGLPMAVLEAAAAGLPLALTDCPGNRDVVDAGIPAILVAPGDDQALSRELDRLIGDSNLRWRLARESAAAVARRFSKARLREQLLATYGEVARDHGVVAAFAR